MFGNSSGDLMPFEPPLGPQPTNSGMYSPQETTIQMREKIFSLSGDDFTIKTAHGQDICTCKGRVVSIRDRKKFTDMQGNELFTLKNKIAIFKSFNGDSPNGHNFVVKGHLKLIGDRSTIEFKNASDNSKVEMEIKGDWIDRKAEIKWGGRPVAKVHRKFFNARELFTDKQTYYVTVAPNVDLSLIAAVCVCLDERENEEDHH